MGNVITQHAFNISILTKIEFLGWDKHSHDGFEKCEKLIELANVFPLDENVAPKAIELKRKANITLADAVIAATAIIHNFRLATKNVDDFKNVEGFDVINPFD